MQLVMPEGPSDLSGSIFLISWLSSSGVNGVINKGCVVVVAVEGRSLFFHSLVAGYTTLSVRVRANI